MGAWHQAEQSKPGGPSHKLLHKKARLAPGETPMCCGATMQPELAEAHDRDGRKLFVTVWRCASCGKAQR